MSMLHVSVRMVRVREKVFRNVSSGGFRYVSRNSAKLGNCRET